MSLGLSMFIPNKREINGIEMKHTKVRMRKATNQFYSR